MTYIYDILLNFNDEFLEFFEWEKGDLIYHVKKIPIFKTNTKFMELIFSKKIKLKDYFGKAIANKTELFGSRKNIELKYSFLITDGYKVIGILLDKDYNIFKISDLLLDEADDAINIANSCKEIEFEYDIVGTRKKNDLLTRREIKIKNYLETNLKAIYKAKEVDKLKYLYFEYFNKNIDSIDEIYKELINTLKNEVNDKHIKLSEFIHLMENSKSAPNLTK